MADDRDEDKRRSVDGDATVPIPAELLSILPPPPEAETPAPPGPAAPPGAAATPRPPGPVVPPPPPPDPADPVDVSPDAGPPPPPRTSLADRAPRSRGILWLVGALLIVALFIAACYFLVARAEDDRPSASDVPLASTEPPDTTAPTTTVPPPETRPPADVAVVVLNGTGQRGWAAENVTKLEEAGYGPEASDASAEDIETTTVYVADDALAPDGAAVATAIGLPDAPVEVRADDSPGVTDAAAEADVVVVLGADSIG